MTRLDVEAIRAEVRALDYVRGTPAEIALWREGDAEARANLAIEGMDLDADEHALFDMLRDEGVLKADPILDQVAAVSCGVCDGVPVLDLDYEEDSEAEADSNFVLTGAGQIVEIQATGEKRGFTRAEFDRLFALAETGCTELFALQKAALEAVRS